MGAQACRNYDWFAENPVLRCLVISSTHTLLALALFTRKDEKVRNWNVFAGSVIPDSFIYVGWLVLTYVYKIPKETIWDEVYFDEPMQTIASLFNSVPLYVAILGIGFYFRKTIWGMAMMFFGLAALSHIALDFPVHNHDAYAHFQPFTDWKFISPISYYERHLHGNMVGLVDAGLAIGASVVLWRRFDQKWVHGILALMILAMITMTVLRFEVFPFR